MIQPPARVAVIFPPLAPLLGYAAPDRAQEDGVTINGGTEFSGVRPRGRERPGGARHARRRPAHARGEAPLPQPHRPDQRPPALEPARPVGGAQDRPAQGRRRRPRREPRRRSTASASTPGASISASSAATATSSANPFHYRDSRTDGMHGADLRPRPARTDLRGHRHPVHAAQLALPAPRDAARPSRQLLDVAETLLFIPDLFNYLFTGVAQERVLDRHDQPDVRPAQADVGDGPAARSSACPTQHPARRSCPRGTVLGQLPRRRRRGVRRRPRSRSSRPAARHRQRRRRRARDRRRPTTGATSARAPGRSWASSSPSRSSTRSRSRYNYTNEGGVGGTIRFLKNIMGLWLVQECRRQWQQEGHEHSYAELTQMAARRQAVRRGRSTRTTSRSSRPATCREDRAVLPGHRASRPPTRRGEFVRTLPRKPRPDLPQDARRAGGRPRPPDRRRSTSSAAAAERAAQPDDRRRLRPHRRRRPRRGDRDRQHPRAGDGDRRREVPRRRPGRSSATASRSSATSRSSRKQWDEAYAIRDVTAEVAAECSGSRPSRSEIRNPQ